MDNLRATLALGLLALVSTASHAGEQWIRCTTPPGSLPPCPSEIPDEGLTKCQIFGYGCDVSDIPAGWDRFQWGCSSTWSNVAYRGPGNIQSDDEVSNPGTSRPEPPILEPPILDPPILEPGELPAASISGTPEITQGQIYLDAFGGEAIVGVVGAVNIIADRRVRSWSASGAAHMAQQGDYIAEIVRPNADASEGDEYSVTYTLRVEGHGTRALNGSVDVIAVTRTYTIQRLN